MTFNVLCAFELLIIHFLSLIIQMQRLVTVTVLGSQLNFENLYRKKESTETRNKKQTQK